MPDGSPSLSAISLCFQPSRSCSNTICLCTSGSLRKAPWSVSLICLFSATLSGVGILEVAPRGISSVSRSDSRRIRFLDRFRTMVINHPPKRSGFLHSSSRSSATRNDSCAASSASSCRPVTEYATAYAARWYSSTRFPKACSSPFNASRTSSPSDEASLITRTLNPSGVLRL